MFADYFSELSRNIIVVGGNLFSAKKLLNSRFRKNLMLSLVTDDKCAREQ